MTENLIIHAVMYRNYQLGTLCNSGAFGLPEHFTAITENVTCPACIDKLEGAGAAARGRHTIEPLPVVGHKAEGETDIERFRTMASKLRRNFDVGGSNHREALARLIDREIVRAGGEV